MTGRLETQGKTVTIEAIQDPENHDPSYVAVDDIFFKADGSCETLPEGADAGPSCGDQERCNDGGCYTKEQFCDFHADCQVELQMKVHLKDFTILVESTY